MKQMNYAKTYRLKVRFPADTLLYNSMLETRSGIGTDTEQHVYGLRTGNFFNVLTATTTINDGTGGTSAHFLSHDRIALSVLTAQNLETARFASDPFMVVRSTANSYTSTSDQAKAGYLGFKVDCVDHNGGNDLFAFKDSVPSFTDLPKYCVDGFTIQVNGDPARDEDNYYVKFSGSNTAGSWEECAKPSRPNDSVYHSFDLSTMPHTLSQNADLSFTFGQGTWNSRIAGDDTSNPFPSFVDSKITDIFLHRNRLGLLSDENVIFSEDSGYFNFFRTTVRTLLDTSPIDVAISQNEVSLLKAAVPAQDDLLLFSEANQFALTATALLTPKEITIEPKTKYECDLTASPIGAGTSVFFATKNGNSSGIREYSIVDDSENADAPLITSHIPNYIKGSITHISASTSENVLLLLTDNSKNECYIYKWYDSNRERIQSSWSKWIFTSKGVSGDTDIVHTFFNNDDLYITFADGSFEKLSLNITASDLTFTEISGVDFTAKKYNALLDHKVKIQASTTGAASFTLSDLNNAFTATANSVFVDHKGLIIATGNSTDEKIK